MHFTPGWRCCGWQDKDGNDIEMGLHVFFGCYFNLFRLMAKCGVLENLLLKVRGRRRRGACGSKRRGGFAGTCRDE